MSGAGSVLVVSASLDEVSRSERAAELYAAELSRLGVGVSFVSLKDYDIPRFDNPSELSIPCRELHSRVATSDALVLASPIYNWGCSAELKRFVELIGSTPPDGSMRGAFFDKIVTFVCSGGLPHSYMGVGSFAWSMILDFKCIINPYHVYVHERQWDGDSLDQTTQRRIHESAEALRQLIHGLSERTYSSGWSV